jgi:hypothetical protein
MNQYNISASSVFKITSGFKKATITIQVKVVIENRPGPSDIILHSDPR